MRKLQYIALLLALVLVLSACSAPQGKRKVRIGTIRVADDKTVAQEMGYIKEAFATQNMEVEFLFFDSGTAANVALAAGAIDFAGMGYTNAVVALSRDLPVELIWIHEVIGEAEALVVAPKANIQTPADLRGKKIATPFASTSHLSLIKALEMNGLHSTDVVLLDMNTEDIVAAWLRGDIDAAYTWEPTLSQIKKTANVLLTSSQLAKQGFVTANIELVHKNFAKQYPELVKLYLQALAKANQLYEQEPAQAIEAAAKHLGIPPEEAKVQMAGMQWLSTERMLSDAYLGTETNTGAFHSVFYQTAEFLKSEKKIDRVPTMEEIAQFINSSYITQ
ncbi:MAG: ABC transporter substrate-binding protein [Eubacteriales bacterium]|nr:ABC transporter substrate-binding protein [Eubacteriales bacterium]